MGILDADICGPSQPRVLGVRGEQVHNSGSGWSPVVSASVKYMNYYYFVYTCDNTQKKSKVLTLGTDLPVTYKYRIIYLTDGFT